MTNFPCLSGFSSSFLIRAVDPRNHSLLWAFVTKPLPCKGCCRKSTFFSLAFVRTDILHENTPFSGLLSARNLFLIWAVVTNPRSYLAFVRNRTSSSGQFPCDPFPDTGFHWRTNSLRPRKPLNVSSAGTLLPQGIFSFKRVS
jgi:hypothetical protein